MNFLFSANEESFREEVRQFIVSEVPVRWGELDPGYFEETQESWGISREFQRKLANKRWLAAQYPPEYGGMSASHWQKVILTEEMAYARAPLGLEAEITVDWVGPSILMFGTDEQKQKYVCGISSGELIFCLGYSEPDAGSDLASIKTTAKEEEDCYVINGQKIWTSFAHCADYMWLAARTDPNAPKHKGISMFVIDMKTPGITVRPIINIIGYHSFNEVFFDNVKVPKDSLIGKKNGGWHQLMVSLTFERSGIAQVSIGQRVLDELIAYAKETERDGRPIADDPIVQHKIVNLATQTEIARLLAYRVTWLQEMGKGSTAVLESSVSKIFQGEYCPNLARTGMEILGLPGLFDISNKRAVLKGKIMRLFLSSLAIAVGGGSAEIQRNIIATRGLGLPAT